MTGPLDGVRVVDLTTMLAGPLATMVLGDQGADIVKVEPPGAGDLIRRVGPMRGELSALFHSVNRNKRSVVVDLRAPRGREILLRIVAGADVFVQNFRPGVVERLGIDEPALRAVRPDLVYVSISAFGESGPYARRPAYDSVIQALSGVASVQADERTGVPAFVRHAVCDKLSALYAAQAITAALFARANGGQGQHVRVAMLDAAVAFLWPDGMQGETFLGDDAPKSSDAGRLPSLRATSDGFVAISVVADAEFQALCRALDAPELADDPRFAAIEARARRLGELGDRIDARTRRLTTRALCERLEAAGVPHAPVTARDALHEDPQILANATLVELDHPTSGRLRTAGPVGRFERTPGGIRRLAPALGEHTDEILGELGLGAEQIAALRADGSAA